MFYNSHQQKKNKDGGWGETIKKARKIAKNQESKFKNRMKNEE